MCLTKGCLKCTIIVSGLLVAILGIVVLVVFVLVGKSEVAKVAEAKTLIMVVGIILGIFFLLIGICGLAAGISENKCLICTFNIFLLIFTCVFLGLFIAIEVMGGNMTDELEDACSGGTMSSFADKFNDVYTNMNDVFCKNEIYSCKVTDLTPFKNNKEYKDYLPYMSENGKYSQIRDITNWESIFYTNVDDAPDDTLLSFLGLIEQKYSCSGFCKWSKFFYFSDVNNGVPDNYKSDKGCYTKMVDFMDGKYNIILGVSIAIAIIFIIVIIFGFCLCCHPETRDKNGYDTHLMS